MDIYKYLTLNTGSRVQWSYGAQRTLLISKPDSIFFGKRMHQWFVLKFLMEIFNKLVFCHWCQPALVQSYKWETGDILIFWFVSTPVCHIKKHFISPPITRLPKLLYLLIMYFLIMRRTVLWSITQSFNSQCFKMNHHCIEMIVYKISRYKNLNFLL